MSETTTDTKAAEAKTADDTKAAEAARTFTQADLDKIVTREKAKASRETETLRAKLAELEEAAAAGAAKGDESAKLARERDKLAAERDAHKAAAEARRVKHHAALTSAAVSRALVGLDFVGADAAEVVEARLHALARVEESDDSDAVLLVDGKTELDAADRAAVQAWVRKRFPSLVKAASGSGGPHGRGAAGAVGPDLTKLAPAEKIAHGLSNPK